MRTTISTLIVGLLSANAIAAQHAMPATPPDSASETPSATQAAPAGTVARAQFTSAVQEREPVDKLEALSNDTDQVYFFTELSNMAGGHVTHRWEFNGQVMAEVGYDVGGNRWRVWSSKKLDPLWLGEWKVSVVDTSGATLAVQTFNYGAAPAQPAAPAESAPATTTN